MSARTDKSDTQARRRERRTPGAARPHGGPEPGSLRDAGARGEEGEGAHDCVPSRERLVDGVLGRRRKRPAAGAWAGILS